MRLGWGVAIFLLVGAGCFEPLPPPDPAPPSYEVPVDESWVWVEADPLPYPVRDAACATYRGQLWVVGGLTDGPPAPWVSGRTQVFDLGRDATESDGWRAGFIGIPEPVYDAMLIPDGTSMLLAGGFAERGDRDPVSSVYELTGINAWVRKGSLPMPLADGAVISDGGRELIVGGRSWDMEPTAGILEWHGGVARGWEMLTELPEPRAGSVAFLSRQLLATLGGENGDGPIADGILFDLDTEGHAALPAMPTARADAGSARQDGLIHVIGGRDSNGAVSSASEFFDVRDSSWGRTTDLPEPVAGACVGALADGLHVVGGYRRDGSVTGQHWVLRSVE